MSELTVLNGKQAGARHSLQHGQSYLFGASEDDDFIFSEAGKARAMLRQEGDQITTTSLAGSVKLNGTVLPQGISQSAPLPCQLDLENTQLRLGVEAVNERLLGAAHVQAAQTQLHKPKSQHGVWLVLIAVLCCISAALYVEATGEALSRDEHFAQMQARGKLMSRWQDRSDVSLTWKEPTKGGRMQLVGFVADNQTEANVRADIAKSGLSVDVKLQNFQAMSQEIQMAFKHGDKPANVRHESGGAFTLTIESDQWAFVKSKVSKFNILPEGLNQIDVIFSDVWMRSNGDALRLRYARSGPLDELGMAADLESLVLPLQTRKSLAAIQLRPTPALVTDKKERILQGAILSNGVELLEIQHDWITLTKNGMVRRQRLG
jgi:hypothetical protein